MFKSKVALPAPADRLSPKEVAEYLKVMRESGLMTGHLVLPGGVQIIGTFAPEPIADEAGTSAAPGGWKQPQQTLPHLDDVDQIAPGLFSSTPRTEAP